MSFTLLRTWNKNLIGFLFFASATVMGQAQPKLTGPTCILTGLDYQYNLNAYEFPSGACSICIQGGTFKGGGNCVSYPVVPASFMVTWKDTAYRQLTITYNGLVNTLSVESTTPLSGGTIDTADKKQFYQPDSTGYSFHCSVPTGGSCTAQYLFQWQVSDNALNWQELEDAKDVNYRYTGPINGDLFFRRVTFDPISNTIAYSDQAVLSIKF